jgi:uncharacterized protein (TIGR03435 family)
VVDLTGIPGAFDLLLEWNLPNPDAPGATIFDATAQACMKLEQRKLPMSVVVIDHVERVPTAN